MKLAESTSAKSSWFRSLEFRVMEVFLLAEIEVLLLHARLAACEGYHAVVICSEDTDVFIMSLAFHDMIGASPFQFRSVGTKTRRRIVDISKVAATVGIHWM